MARREAIGPLVVVLAVVAMLVAPAASVAAVQARSADSFVESIGVNIHLPDTTTPYSEDFGAVKRELEALGVRHVRDVLFTGTPDVYDRIGELAGVGIKSTLILGDPDDGSWVLPELLAVLREKLAGDVDAVEGPNEYSAAKGGAEWASKLARYQERLYEEIKGEPPLAALPVIGPSIVANGQAAVGDISGSLDYGNIHSYPQGGPPEKLSPAIEHAKLNSQLKPIMATETGYHTALNWSGENRPVSEEAMGTYMPRLFFEYFRRDIARTFDYELVDEQEEPEEEDKEAHFGLLRNDLSRKPAFTALSNTIHLLEDPGPAFAPSSLSDTLSDEGAELPSGDSPELHTMLLEKRDGSFYLALWRLAGVWNPETQQPIAAVSKPVTLSFGEGLESAAEYLPTSSLAPVWSSAQPSEPLIVQVGPQVVLLKLVPAAPGAPLLPFELGAGSLAPVPPAAVLSSPAPRCVVPKLKGTTLRVDRRRLRKAGCALGEVRGGMTRAAKVRRQSSRPGRVLPAGSKIDLTLRG